MRYMEGCTRACDRSENEGVTKEVWATACFVPLTSFHDVSIFLSESTYLNNREVLAVLRAIDRLGRYLQPI